MTVVIILVIVGEEAIINTINAVSLIGGHSCFSDSSLTWGIAFRISVGAVNRAGSMKWQNAQKSLCLLNKGVTLHREANDKGI